MKLAEMRDNDQWCDMTQLFLDRTAKHIALVQKYAEIIYYRCDEVGASLVTNSHEHDASKYLPPEIRPYIYLTWGKQNGMDFSGLFALMPIEKVHGYKTSDDIRAAIRSATLHHITTNKHHPEAHADSVQSGPRDSGEATVPLDLPNMDVISMAEMCADWAAMSEELGTDLVEWATKNIGSRWQFTSGQRRLIYKFLQACVANG